MAEILLQSPLNQAKRLAHSTADPQSAGIILGERAFLNHINLRVDGNNAGFCQAVQELTSCELPVTANTVSASGQYTICWSGPDEWLIIAPADAGDLADKLNHALADQFAAVNDISSGQTIITISGEYTRQLLSKGCSLDLHPDVFATGQCAQSLLAKASVLLYPVAADAFEIVVRRSYADYLWQWLRDASREYGYAVI